jgi:hypothetical protein
LSPLRKRTKNWSKWWNVHIVYSYVRHLYRCFHHFETNNISKFVTIIYQYNYWLFGHYSWSFFI